MQIIARRGFGIAIPSVQTPVGVCKLKEILILTIFFLRKTYCNSSFQKNIINSFKSLKNSIELKSYKIFVNEIMEVLKKVLL